MGRGRQGLAGPGRWWRGNWGPTSIRHRLIRDIALVLAASLLFDAGMTYIHGVAKVRTEMRAALAVGINTAQNAVDDAVDDAEEEVSPARRIRLIVADFNGDRHLRASLTGPDGTVLAQSRLLPPTDPAPRWFARLFDAATKSADVTLPATYRSIGQLRLLADPRDEIGEAWSDAELTASVLFVFFILVVTLVYLSLRATIRPTAKLCQALERIGDDDYGTRLATPMPDEFEKLRTGVNTLAERLEQMRAQNISLNEQLMVLQEEERTEVARDLHDDVAPFLFAVGADAAMIRQFIATRAIDAILPRAEAILDSVRHMQKHLRQVLGRLMPDVLIDLGLAAAVAELVAFWKTRCADIDFSVQVAAPLLGPRLDRVVFRLIQEGLSNAVRHGDPTKITISVVEQVGQAHVRIQDNGSGLRQGKPQAGFGLPGMQERVRAVGGTLAVANQGGGAGVVVSAVLPLPEPEEEDTRVVRALR